MHISKRTQEIRHRLVRRLAPRFYDDYRPSMLPRPFTLFCKKTFGSKLLTGAEIGVHSGLNAENILKTLNVRKLYLIDPYLDYQENDNPLMKMPEGIKAKAIERLHSQQQVEWLFETSEKAVKSVGDLDFAYIDGNHAYEFVKKDIELYYEKVRAGGVLGGHDFTLKYYPDVCFASVEFARLRKLRLYGDVTDWWLIKK